MKSWLDVLWPPRPEVWILESDLRTIMMYHQGFADKAEIRVFVTLSDAYGALIQTWGRQLKWPDLIICTANLDGATIERFVIDARKKRGFHGPMIAAGDTVIANHLLCDLGCDYRTDNYIDRITAWDKREYSLEYLKPIAIDIAFDLLRLH